MSSNKKNCKHYEYRVIDGYEVLGDVISKSSSDIFKSKSNSQEKEEKIESDYANFRPQVDDEDESDYLYNSYVGGKTQTEIERHLKKNIAFFFYHKMSESSMINDLKIHLHLYMAYRNIKGEIFHFRIKNGYSSESYNHNYYYLNGPYGKGPHFDDLNNLIKYYKMKTEGVKRQETEED